MFKQVENSGLWTSQFKSRLYLILALLIYSSLVHGQEKNMELRQLAEQRVAARGEVIIRFIKTGGYSLDYFTRFLSIDNVQFDTITAYAGKKGFEYFLTLNLPFEVLSPPFLEPREFRRSYDMYNQYPSYPEYLAIMDSFSRAFPAICRLVEVGKSAGNHKILAMKISDNPEIREPEPAVFLTSTIHGDEPLGFYLMLRMIDELLGHYETDGRIKRLVDSLEIWINPLANPDGTYFISDNSINGATRFNANQVDLNRNFPDPVDGDHPDNNEWQGETKAMMSFMKGIPLVLAANFHGGSEVVNYPWDTFMTLHPDNSWYEYISHMYADTAQAFGPPGYMTARDDGITNGYQWYPVHGGRQDYVNYFLHGREVTIELSYDKMPAESSLNDYWNYNKKSLFSYIEQAFTGITGTVTDSVTGLPLYASVSIPEHDMNNSLVYTGDSTGIFYRLTEPGKYVFEIEAPGYAVKKIAAEVIRDILKKLNIKLTPLQVPGLFPNPFSDRLYVNISEPGDKLLLQIFDPSGRKVRQIRQPVLVAGKQEIIVNGLSPGIYIVNLVYRFQTLHQVVEKF